MKDDASPQGWELEEGSDADDRWVLEDSEQHMSDEWDLEGTPEPVGQWQPVEYDKPRRAGPAWILPTVVTVALLAVLGYSAYTLVPSLVESLRNGTAGIGQAPPEGTPPTEEGAAVAAAEETPTEEATETPPPTDTPTEEPPTPTPSPTLSVAQQLFATVLSEYGVNARSEPSVDSQVLQILEQNDTFIVLQELDDGWLMLFVSDGPLEAGQPISGFAAYASAEFFAQARQPFAESLYQAVLAAAGIEPTATPVPPTPTSDGTTSGDLALPTVTPVPEPQSEAPPATLDAAEPTSVTITIDAVSGANVRTLPELNSDVVTLLADQTEVLAIGRYATNDWILVDLGDGATGWVYAELAVVNGDLTTLPLITLGELPAPSPTPTETPTPEPTPTSPPVEPPTPYSSELPAGVPGAIVFSAAGVNARNLPSAESGVVTILPENAALPVVGRSTNGEWLQVELPQGGTAWVFRAAIIPRGDVNSVPVTEGEAETASPTATPASEPEPVATEVPAVESTMAATAPATDAEPTAEATAQPSTGATAKMRLVVVPVYAAPSSDGESIERIGRSTEVPATGRTADGAWVQVQSSSGDLGWVTVKSVELSVDVDSLPVVQ